MIPQRLLKIITHPLFIGLLITLAVFYFVPPVFNRYRVKTVENTFIRGNDINYYEDLDEDHISEKIRFDRNSSNIIKILLYKGSNTVSQTNLDYQTPEGKYFYFGDFNNDRRKELFVFSWRRDSVFLNILDLLSDTPYLLRNRFIDRNGTALNGFELPVVTPVGLTDYDRDGYKEFVFNLHSSFGKQPRNLYVYNIYTGSLVKSPESGAAVHNPQFFDLNGDSVPEIVFGTLGVGNIDSLFPYSDQHAWLMALDKDLDFIFHPVPFDAYPCRLFVVPVATEEGNRLFALNDYFGNDSIVSTLSIFDEKGKRVKKKEIKDYERSHAFILPAHGEQKNGVYFIHDRPSVIEMLDCNLTTVKRIRGPDFHETQPLESLDADGDGNKEYFFVGNEPGLYYIVRNDFSSSTSVAFGSSENPLFLLSSVILRGPEKSYLYIPIDHGGVTLEYARNPWYGLRYAIVFGFYLAVSGFIYLIFLLQRYRARIHFETARRMTELQMKSIKNQIDPHFTLNILNAIGSLYATSENRDAADYLFGKYARMLRQTVLTSDQVEVTLGDELEFVKNYLDLEKFRLNNKFEYTIGVGDGVDTSLHIPRMLIHTFAENAVKYAFRPMDGKGRLEISITRQPGKYCTVITDNGPGLKGTNKTLTPGMGKGLEILDEMIQLYYSLKKIKISYSLEDVLENGVCAGMRVTVEIRHLNI
jgi:hypothetical protein